MDLILPLLSFSILAFILYVVHRMRDEQHKNFLSANSINKDNWIQLSTQITQLVKLNEIKLDNIKKSLDNSLSQIRNDNTTQLEKIRLTVDEKLHDTLDKRLTESFKLVESQLEVVHKGLGEMHTLATGVGDLKKVLTNVNTRGLWGEVQLEALIKQILSSNQYEYNVEVVPNSKQRVEFAIKIPTSQNEVTLMPIDSKFPLEDFQRLIELSKTGDINAIAKEQKKLYRSISKAAKDISEKYISPPYTTDFAIMFLPVESIYAEILKTPNIIEELQNTYRVIITSPTTLTATLKSLQIGFRAFAIEKQTTYIWKILSSLKTEFTKFTTLLNKTKQKLEQASNEIGKVENKSKNIETQLEKVEYIDYKKLQNKK